MINKGGPEIVRQYLCCRRYHSFKNNYTRTRNESLSSYYDHLL